ncbi:MAG TPA: C4-type zinc ribbon domain-containing protein [Actinomycetota bacterium]
MDRLLDLQQVDVAIARLRSRQGALEAGEDVRQARARVEEAEQVLGELRLQLSAIDRDVQRLENDADMLGQKADAEEKRLYDGSVANPKELEAIQHEVASVRERRRRVDDQLLDRMVEREDLETRMAEAEAELQRLRRALDELRGEAGVELDQIAVSLRERETEREALLPLFDEELLGLYEDLRRSKRGVAAAALVDGVCQGCHTKLSSAEIARLKTVDLKRCEYCDRILVPAST